MTNEEAIKQLKFLARVDSHVDTKEAIEIIIQSIQENIKLKAEIEQLKSTISKMETTTAQEDDLK